jgi:hypothetical protein
MRTLPRLGAVNAAIVALYFAPVWAGDALSALTSPFYGLENPTHAAAAAYFRGLFDFGLVGLVRTSSVLAAIKFVIAVGFVAYLIDFARAVVVGREPDRLTLDLVLAFAAGALMLWAWPALGTGDASLVRPQATQFLLLCGALFVIAVERHIEEGKAAAKTQPSATQGFLLRPSITTS